MPMWVKNIWNTELRLWLNAQRVILRPGDVGRVEDAQAQQMIKSRHLEEVIPGAVSKPVGDKPPAPSKKKVIARKKVVVRKKSTTKRRPSIQDALR